MSNSENQHDAFAAIGSQQSGQVDSVLTELAPAALNKQILGSGKHQEDSVFSPIEEVNSLEKLEPHLKKLRIQATRFEQNLAPAVHPTIRQRSLEVFDWRIATEEDFIDFETVYKGKGSWAEITLPHYGEPIGPATTFYRKEFTLNAEELNGRALYLRFRGVDYKAHVFVNGTLAGSHEGFFAAFEFDISRMVREGKNTLLVRVDNDYSCLGESQHHELPNYDGDKIMAATNQGYDEPMSGWHHCPPGMGIYQEVLLESRPVVHVNDVFVRPLQDLERAELWVEINNTLASPSPIQLMLSVYGQNFEAITHEDRQLGEDLEAGRGVNFYKFEFPITDARQWTPDTPWLYQAQVSLLTSGEKTSTQTQQFGMRWFEIDETKEPKGMPYLNGQKIRLRGANTMGHEQQCVMRSDFDQLREDLLLAKAAHMNFLRFTQRPVQTEIYEACDRLGILTQTDLPLFAHLRRNQFSEAVRQAVEMERHVRSHACNILVSYINEPFPEEWRNMSHRRLARPDLERFFKAATESILVENPDRVVKPVDGDYDPPTWGLPDNHSYTYWYLNHGIDAGKLHKGYWMSIKRGWNYGCGEFGAEGLDRLELLQKYCPEDWLPTGPDDTNWSPKQISKAQSWKMGELFFDPPNTAQEWIDFSRTHQAHAMQRMTEAFRRDPRNVSCAIHLFIDAWPTGWMKTIVDVDRIPKPAYYAYRDALTPLMVNLRSDRDRYWSGETLEAEVWLCNDTNTAPKELQVHWQLENEEGNVLHAESFSAEAIKCEPSCQGLINLKLPRVTARSSYTVRAALFRGKDCLHQSHIGMEVFAEPEMTPSVFALDEKAKSIAESISVNSLSTSPENVILCGEINAFHENEEHLLNIVENGGTLILLELPIGEHHIAGRKLQVKESSMGPHYFVSRRTGHSLVSSFEAHDFYWWYNAKLDRPAPLHDSVLLGNEWNTILRTTDNGWVASTSQEVAVCVEANHGDGRIIVCQLTLQDFLKHNPPARYFLQELLTPATTTALV